MQDTDHHEIRIAFLSVIQITIHLIVFSKRYIKARYKEKIRKNRKHASLILNPFYMR